MSVEKLNVVVIDDEPIFRIDLKEMLENYGYQVLGEAGDGFDAIEICKKNKPDLVLMDIKMPLLDGLSAAKIIHEENLADTVVLLTAYSDSEFIDIAKRSGVCGYLVKPIDEKSLMPNIELAVERSREIRSLKTKYHEISVKLEDRKTIEKAKGILMTSKKLNEQEAYQYIRSVSRTKDLSMKRVAEIILANEGV